MKSNTDQTDSELINKINNNEQIREEIILNEASGIDTENSSFNNFSNELKLLYRLFGKSIITEKCNRLKIIYETTEKLWEEQLKNLPKDGIKYLFITEAPPYSPDGDVTYIYNPNSEPRTLLKALSKAFFNEPLYKIIGTPETLKRLASEGLIIVDSLPFPMDYSSKRDNRLYEEIIGQTVNKYMLPKLNRVDLNWSKDLRFGFGFKRNAIAVIGKLNNELKINKFGNSIKITSEMITANDAGYPDAQNIKKVFGL